MKALAMTATSTALTLLLAAPVAAQISFDPAVSYGVGQEPAGVAAGDLDGDLAPELVVSSDLPDKVSVLPNAGDGTFGPRIDLLLGAGTAPHGVAAANLDGDLDVDFVVTLKNVNAVQLLLNEGGTLTAGAVTAVGGLLPRDVVAGDLDLNGFADVVTSNRDSDDVSVLLNTAGVLAAAVTYAAGQEPRGLALGHFNDDDLPDLAVAANDDRQVSVLLNLGGGTFGAPIALSVGPDLRPTGVAAADLDRDGKMDVATTTSDVGLDFATVFLRSGDGTFGPPTNFPVAGVNPDGIVADDLDLDGLPDLATADQDSNLVSALPGLGGGAFGAPIGLPVGATPGPLIGSDLDRNGAPDLVTANSGSNDVSVLLNRGSGLIFADGFESGDTSAWSGSLP